MEITILLFSGHQLSFGAMDSLLNVHMQTKIDPQHAHFPVAG